MGRPAGGSHKVCRTRFTISGLTTAPKSAHRGPAAPRGGRRRGPRKAAPRRGPAGPSPKRASRSPEPPAGAAGRGGAGENLPTRKPPDRGTSKPAQARARRQGPGRNATRARPTAAQAPGPEPAAPEARRAGRGGTRRGHALATAGPERRKGDRTGSPHRSGWDGQARRGQREPTERERAHEAERGSRGARPGGGAGERSEGANAGPAPRSGGGRAAPERTRAGEGAPAQGGTRSAQKSPRRGQARTPLVRSDRRERERAARVGPIVAPGPGAQAPGGRRPRRVCAGGRRGAAAP